MARPDFRSQAAARLAAERTEHTPALLDLLRPDEPGEPHEVRRIEVERISSNPGQPRQRFDEEALQDLAASIREHGVLQPILVRPRADGHYQIIAGERRWRAARIAGLTEVPCIVEQIDDEAALEIAIIENLQREDISPLEEAEMFERMTTEHGYSLRKLAQKLGKDKGYVENRLRLADAPPEVRELVAVRRDTLSHAYELMKVDDPRKRRRLARQVSSGELSLVKLRQRIEGRPPSVVQAAPESPVTSEEWAPGEELAPAEELAVSAEPSPAFGPELVAIPVEPEGLAVDAVDIEGAAEHLSAAMDELIDALRTDVALAEASSSERAQFAKYLTLSKIKLENAIAVVRRSESREPIGSPLRRESVAPTPAGPPD